MDFLDQLNTSQREAVTYTEGASLIVAGAGSGKTRVLTYRIAYLLQQGVPASRIMALTFTNKAAREMKERIEKLLSTFHTASADRKNFQPSTARYLAMGTFHSTCTRLIRPYADILGYTRDFSIYDTTDSKSVIKAICKEQGLDEKIYKPAAVLSRISMAKNSGIGPRDYGLNQQLLREDREMRMYDLSTVYSLYEARLKAANAMDFDDLLINMLRLMEISPEVKQKYQQQFQYILVDEYQDTNYIQFKLVERLAAPQNNICVVGDDAQSIYSFRGADIRNILNFRQVYPQAKLFKLEQNYRSTQNIVNAANALIHKNQHQIEKTVFSEKEEGQPLSLQPYMDDRTEALGVATKIMAERRKAKGERYGYNDFAVLYRTNAQSRVIEGELRKLNIPYRIYGGTSFYQRKEIKDALGYLRLAVNARDNEALLRIVGFPGRGIGDTTMRKVAENAIEHHRCYLDVMRSPDETGLEVGAAVKKKLQTFAQMIDSFHDLSETMDAYAFTEHVLKMSGVMTALSMDRTQEGIDRAQNVQELLNAIREFVEQRANEGIDYTPITDFLSEVSLQTDQDENLADTTERVTLMTVHAAKGLEFPVVFIVGLEENLFPSQFAIKPQEIEEERRLLYVAITRAMEQCHLSFARQRFRNGTFSFNSYSRFLNDIDKRFFEIEKKREPAPSLPRIPSLPSTPSSPKSPISNVQSPISNVQSPILSSSFKPDDRVSHRVFGVGTVVRVYRDEVTENDKIEIRFDTQGTKTLLLTHAKLEKISSDFA